MTDQEALKLIDNRSGGIDETAAALSHAVNRLRDYQWHPYSPNSFAEQYDPNTMHCRLIVGVKFSDGTRASVCGKAMRCRDEWKLILADDCLFGCGSDIVIEQWMQFPSYTKSQL